MNDCSNSSGDTVVVSTIEACTNFRYIQVDGKDCVRTAFTTYRNLHWFPSCLATEEYSRHLFAQNIRKICSRDTEIGFSIFQWYTNLPKTFLRTSWQYPESLETLEVSNVPMKLAVGNSSTKTVAYLGQIKHSECLEIVSCTKDAFCWIRQPTTLTGIRSFYKRAMYLETLSYTWRVRKHFPNKNIWNCPPSTVESIQKKDLKAPETLKSACITPPALATLASSTHTFLNINACNVQDTHFAIK